MEINGVRNLVYRMSKSQESVVQLANLVTNMLK